MSFPNLIFNPPRKKLLCTWVGQNFNLDVVLRNTQLRTGRVAQWIRRLPTEQEIPGSIPGTFKFFYQHFFIIIRIPRRFHNKMNLIIVLPHLRNKGF
jgi:hypothetical protein